MGHQSSLGFNGSSLIFEKKWIRKNEFEKDNFGYIPEYSEILDVENREMGEIGDPKFPPQMHATILVIPIKFLIVHIE